MNKQRIPTSPKQGTLIRFIILTEPDPNIPFSELLIGEELPLVLPFYPDDNKKFLWDKKTGKTKNNIPLAIKMDYFLVLLESKGNNYRDSFEKESIRKKTEINQKFKHLRFRKTVLDKTLNIQSKYCKLSS